MAAVVELVKRRDFGSDISSLSLFNYEDGFSLARDGWVQAATSDDEVAETMTLLVEGSSHNDLADKLKLLDDKIQEAAWYRDGVERYGVWLRAKLTDEGGARQALVTGMQCEPDVSFYAPPVAPGNFIHGYHLALTRMPYWEATSHLHSYGIGSLNCTGGLDGGGLVQGNAPARIAQTEFKGMAGGGGPLYEFWLGFRTDRFGDQANFAPVWDIGQSSDSVPYNDTTSTADGTAQGSYKWRCTFGDPALLRRVAMVLQSFTANYADQRGSFIVLLRAKVGSGTTCRIRLHDGFIHTAAGLRTQPRAEITSTDWMLYPLGTVDIPPSHGITDSQHMRQYGFELYAERTAGSSYLDMDCIVLIPCAEGAVHVAGAAVQRVGADQRPATVMMTADGMVDGWAYQGNLPYSSLVVEPGRYALPTGDVSFVLAGQREASHVLADFVGITLYTYRRWRSLRGHDEALDDY